MPKREKRLKKGIESIEEQIEIHRNKLKKAKEDNNEYLEKYYEKELDSLEKVKDLKKSQLDR
ncbi:MAG: hypothetical protein WC979_08155 [Candidatus Pacearchaeota archaeon]|jgi:hypothetical protein